MQNSKHKKEPENPGSLPSIFSVHISNSQALLLRE